ncbi:periplasmic binding protein-like I [Rhizoclosmatium globosum]|uniref:Periplasmic binding protein-like I n=1 Tax=Rhizoclosmatium globosum TaxID=329046 RepID=A0A1Y2CEH1_9FUNG|nr:periplasmic binding protein-like I [Rhizoclosmatium globosum]|eukprot:ORY45326.1 periplasmic binding protein-like I [Rhizoclosmatium globosum]
MNAPLSPLSNKLQSSITVGIVNWYCYLPNIKYNGTWAYSYNSTFDPTRISFSTQGGIVYIQDAVAAAAIDIVNNSPDILPYTTVNIKRFTDCGPWWPQVDRAFNGHTTGYAMAAMATEIAEKHTDVIGLTGGEYSGTTKGTAAMFGAYQIPYCSAIAGSPVLSDKDKFPYLFRMIASTGYGNHVATLLSAWNVTRMAIIVQSDDILSSGFQTDISRAMKSRGIRVISIINLKTPLTLASVLLAKDALLRANARYIYIASQADYLNKLYFSLAVEGMIGPQYVYISLGLPAKIVTFMNGLSPKLVEANKNSTLLASYVGGFISLTAAVAPGAINSTYKSALLTSFLKITQFDVGYQKYYGFDTPENLINYWNIAGYFDCAMLLLYGFDKLLKQNPQFTPQQLASRKISKYLNYTQFLDLNYPGITSAPQPITLNQYGDPDLPYYVSYALPTPNPVNPDSQFQRAYFGQTNSKGNQITFFIDSPPYFHGGSTVPPPDGPPIIRYTLLSNGVSTPNGGGIITLAVLGLLLSTFFMAVFYIYRETKQLKMTSVPECLVTIAGSLLCYISLFMYIDDVTAIKCVSRVWFALAGYVLMIMPVVMKNVRLYIILKSKTRVDGARITLINRIIITLGVLIELGLLGFWQSSTTNDPVLITQGLNQYYICSSVNLPFSYSIQILEAFTAVIHILLLVLAYMMKDVDSMFNESPALMSICALVGILVAVIEILPSNPTSSLDSIQCICIWLATTLTLVLLFGQKVYDVAYEHLIEKGFKRLTAHKSSFEESTIAKPAKNSAAKGIIAQQIIKTVKDAAGNELTVPSDIKNVSGQTQSEASSHHHGTLGIPKNTREVIGIQRVSSTHSMRDSQHSLNGSINNLSKKPLHSNKTQHRPFQCKQLV